jgi:hypothetical protein
MRDRVASAAAALAVAAWAHAGIPLTQVGHFATGFDGSGRPLLIPAIDPAGIGYHDPTGHLFIADSEIEEVPAAFAIVGANVFEVSPSGNALYATYDLTALGNLEPTGITYNGFDGFFYVTDDDARTLTRYSFSPGPGFAVDDEVSTLSTAGSDDPEGVTCDPATGLVYVVDGHGAFVAVYAYDNPRPGWDLVDVLDLNAMNDPADVPNDPEGIAYAPCSGHLFLVTGLEDRIYEFTSDGFFVARYELNGFSPAVIAPQGLTFGAASDGSPGVLSLYVADGGIDNNNDPDERDGDVYEADTGCVGGGEINHPPVIDPIPDESIEVGSTLSLTATAFDPDPLDTLAFSLTGSPPAGASIDPVTGEFNWTPGPSQGPADWDITVRVTDDGVPPLWDQTTFTVTVTVPNSAPIIDPIPDQTVPEEAQLSLIASAIDPDPVDTITFSLVGPPAGASIHPVTGQLTWTPSEAQGPGTYTLTVRASDDGTPPLWDQTAFDVTVQEVNLPPVLDRIGRQTVAAGEQLTFTATASDPDTAPGAGGGLVANWPLDVDFTSLTGAAHGTPVNGASITSAAGEWVLGGGALLLDGLDDFVSFGDIPLTGDLTVVAWVYPLNIASGTASQAVVFGDLADDDWVRIEGNNSRIRFDGDTNAISTNPDFVNGSWQHFGLVRSGTTVTVYRNGVATGTDIQDTPFIPELLGHKSPSPNFFWGFIDDAAVWDRAIDPQDIAYLYNGGAGNSVGSLGQPPLALAFSLEGDVPPGAWIDPASGAFTWTAGPSAASYTFTVRVTDNGAPPLSDEEEITVTVTPGPTCDGDVDGDGAVGIGDLLMLLAAWGTDPGGPPDLDGDGVVGINDLLALLKSWGPCT